MKKQPPIEGMKTMPYGLPLMMDAWVGCLNWCASNPKCIIKFQNETGYKAPQSPVEKMIDEQTGYNKKMIVDFCDFVTKNFWGEE